MKKALLFPIIFTLVFQSWNGFTQMIPLSSKDTDRQNNNIRDYRDCQAPQNLEAQGGLDNWSFIVLTWDPISVDTWLQYDNGANYNAIGTVGAIEFDAAARWTPGQLADYTGASLTKVAFFPTQASATYSIRVWTGELAANLIVDQPVVYPEFDAWNYIDLDAPVPIDTSQELWVGYHVNSTWGYPAGADNGPAVDGYGDMIKYGTWKTLLQFNPDLDYNWNIEAYISSAWTDTTIRYGVYRSDDGAPWFQRAISDQNYYYDDSVCGWAFMHEYKVTAIYIDNNDTCESDYSNVAYEVCEGIYEDEPGLRLKVYPNPVHDVLMIESGETMGLISIYNYDGRMIFRKEINAQNCTFPVREYPEGMYLLRIETGKDVVFRKIVIMR